MKKNLFIVTLLLLMINVVTYAQTPTFSVINNSCATVNVSLRGHDACGSGITTASVFSLAPGNGQSFNSVTDLNSGPIVWQPSGTTLCGTTGWGWDMVLVNDPPAGGAPVGTCCGLSTSNSFTGTCGTINLSWSVLPSGDVHVTIN